MWIAWVALLKYPLLISWLKTRRALICATKFFGRNKERRTGKNGKTKYETTWTNGSCWSGRTKGQFESRKKGLLARIAISEGNTEKGSATYRLLWTAKTLIEQKSFKLKNLLTAVWRGKWNSRVNSMQSCRKYNTVNILYGHRYVELS